MKLRPLKAAPRFQEQHLRRSRQPSRIYCRSGVRWVDCDWLEAVPFARDRQTGLLAAFVAVNISFEAIEGGDMEDVAAVSNIRDAAAVFHYEHGRWGTGGRALFNMNPTDALERLQSQFAPVGGPGKGLP